MVSTILQIYHSYNKPDVSGSRKIRKTGILEMHKRPTSLKRHGTGLGRKEGVYMYPSSFDDEKAYDLCSVIQTGPSHRGVGFRPRRDSARPRFVVDDDARDTFRFKFDFRSIFVNVFLDV